MGERRRSSAPELLFGGGLLAKIEEHGDDFSASMGAEGIRELLRAITSMSRSTPFARNSRPGSDTKIKKLAKRLKCLEGFQKSGISPTVWSWRCAGAAPELRPLVPLDGGRFATSDLNDLYPQGHQPQQPPQAAARA